MVAWGSRSAIAGSARRYCGRRRGLAFAGIRHFALGSSNASLSRLTIPLREWLEKAAAPPLVRRHGISPAVAAELASLPDSFHRDPADRILVATARVLGATLLTQDSRIAEAELVDTLS